MYIEQVGSSEKISVICDGLAYFYEEIALETEDATLLQVGNVHNPEGTYLSMFFSDIACYYVLLE